VIVAVLLTTLLSPPARRLERRGWRPAPAAAAAVVLAVVAFLGLWALIIPAFVSSAGDLLDQVQSGAVQITDALKPLGVGRADVDRAVRSGVRHLHSGGTTSQVLDSAVLVTQWLAAIVLIVMLTFFFVKDGARIWDWIVELFHEDRQPVVRDVGDRAWAALAGYVQGVFLVATLDAVFIGIVLVLVGVPMALPLIVLTFVAAFFPIVGAFSAGAAAVLVALVANGLIAAIVVLVGIVLVQQLEGNVFYPVVVGRRLRLHPVAILLALTAGGVLAGIAGAFLAIPVASVTSAVLAYMRERREARYAGALVAP
jgi:predicted PurR-regulated permease PerM